MEDSKVTHRKRILIPLIILAVVAALAAVTAGAYLGLCRWVQTNGRLLPGVTAVDDKGAVVADLGKAPLDAAESDADWESCCLRWTDCPALTALDLGDYEETMLNETISGAGQELFSGLYIARRGFWTEESCENIEACDALWDAITKGANP